MLFKKRVKRELARYVNVMELPKGGSVDFISFHRGRWKAFRVKPHGRLSSRLIHNLENYQRATAIPVYIVSEQAGHVSRYQALDRYLRTRDKIRNGFE